MMLRRSPPSIRRQDGFRHASHGVRLARAKQRGATMVEYALLIIAIMVLAAGAYRELGKRTRLNGDKASAELDKK
ncbi:hypothetical protein AKJ09_05605 [Labilithrix luteola]|uniref:Uncharacterized protein n=1 Tax=Labilithrix luteola TaxID=1391654 RepID=A0A0K1PZX8_9BACT|nr:hypothetical protein [Labilithrix luteola]AKU98941.1 hypothetical protein AKJ09_05605 [Labilithrix luteola]